MPFSFFPSRRGASLRHSLAALALLAGALPPALSGQESLAQRVGGDDTVHLSEFEVNAGSQTGYIASESMTGSRIPTKIKDLPFNIDVITNEFMNDFAITDYSKLIQGGMLTADQDAGNSYTVRGIISGGQLYNGFWQPAGTPVPTALRDRTEILNGPSAGVYGQTSPGGMLNIVSKQPKFQSANLLRFTAGSYDSFNPRLESTGALTSRDAYLVILDANQRSFNQPWHENRSQTAAFSLLHRFSATSSLKLELVAANQRNHSPSNRVPYLFNSVTQKYYGIAYNIENKSGTGPNSYKNNDNYSAFLTYETKLSEVFSLRTGAEAYSVNSRSFNTTDVTSYDPDPTHAGANLFSTPFFGLTRLRSPSSSFSAPSYQNDNREGGGFQADLLAHYWLFHHNVENRSLATVDYSSFYEYILKVGMPQSVKTSATGAPTLSATGAPSVNNADDPAIFPSAPRFAGDLNYWVPVFDPLAPAIYNDPATGLPVNVYNLPSPGSGLYQIKSWQKTRRDVFGVMLRQQSTLWNKLLLFGTVRFDNVLYNVFTKQYPNFSLSTYPTLASYVATAYPGGYQGSVSHFHSDAITGSGGFNYRITPGISAYGNYSTSFVPSTQVVTGATTGSYILPNETAQGYDYGFKSSLLQDRLTFTVGGFYIHQEHVSVTANDANGLAIKQAVGTVVSKGGEFSGNYFVTPNWAINAGYYYTNARWVEAGNDLDLVGRHRADVPADLYTLATKYSFLGGLKGISVFALYQYIGKANAEERGNTTVTNNITPVGSNNGLRDIILPAAPVVNIGAAYDFRLPLFGRRTTQHLQFNVGNLLDRNYITLSRSVGDKRTYSGTYQISF